jgi:hypothetical protein
MTLLPSCLLVCGLLTLQNAFIAEAIIEHITMTLAMFVAKMQHP